MMATIKLPDHGICPEVERTEQVGNSLAQLVRVRRSALQERMETAPGRDLDPVLESLTPSTRWGCTAKAGQIPPDQYARGLNGKRCSIFL